MKSLEKEPTCFKNPRSLYWIDLFLTNAIDPFISESCIEIKIELNFPCHNSLWCLKRFYEGPHKTF